MEISGATTRSLILCCNCGAPIEPNAANMCLNCIRGRVDITEGIPKKSTVYYCRQCARYLQPPKFWLVAELESKELLGLLIKRLRGLNKVKLIDASFKWTEPHSRRIIIRLTIQKEVFLNTILEDSFTVEFVVLYQQCERCRRDAAKIDAWQAVVQVRQKVEHKRSFMYLEQLILKHGAHEEALGIKQMSDGIDFFFISKSAALKFVSFLQQVMPIKHKSSEHLVSHDPKSNHFRYKYTFSVDIAPVCKDDLVCLPLKLSQSFGGLGPIVIVSRVSQSIVVTDPTSLRHAEIAPNVYWRYGFVSLMNSRQLVEYTILDVENTGEASGRNQGAYITAAKSSDFGANDNVVLTRSHLGAHLSSGDISLGYDLKSANYNEALIEGHKHLELEDCVLVKKTYPRMNRRRRKWKLKSMVVDADEQVDRGNDREELDREQFLRELEQDPDLRLGVNIYKDPAAEDAMTDAETNPDEYPDIPLDELIDGLNIEDGPDEE
uniref:60S ribosomal export protein NMD3 n=2 Tax=Rhodosorus marinus TaxID=101924 RepID=A0A7S3EE79_9RHOD|mmetsp:Transcript_26811/g.104115  ORF Transcript_26811/g.104115 Transcript_26811/m.104115 type:complete len:492 (+) Transcript_26811:93-1568(+)